MSAADQNSPVELQLAGDVVRAVQLTDTHLCPERGGKLLGMDTDHSLQAVIDLVTKERDVVDLVLATGDLADDGADTAYERLADYFTQFSCPNFWLPGNHDDRRAMTDKCAGRAVMGREVRAGNWQIVMLDSQIPGEVGGELGGEELTWLSTALKSGADAALHTLVVLHHHPILMGSAWLDEQIVADADQFFEVLDRHDNVRAVLWGHVHQETDTLRNNVRLLSSPSTCVQFAPGSVDFAAEQQPPGYRWLDLHPDGRLDTGVSRVHDVEFTVHIGQGGYL